MKVNVPKDFLLGPIFTATPQKGPRSLTVGTRHYQIGGFHPLDPLKKPPGLDVRHAPALFTLLSFRSIVPGSPLVRFSMREFSKRWCRSYGGVHARTLRVLLGDLLDTYFRVHDTATAITHTYRLIQRIDIEHRPLCGRRRSMDGGISVRGPGRSALWFGTITLSPEFVGLLDHSGAVQPFDLGVLSGMRSRLAQAIYLYLPSRAYHHTREDPFSITLTRLLEQVGQPIPPTPRLRHKLFTQHRKSILAQINGTRTLTGTLQLRLERTSDGQDWKVIAWIERAVLYDAKPVRERSKLVDAFLASGRTREELARRLTLLSPLDDYESDLLERGKVEIEKNIRFLTMAKALLGQEVFRGLASEAKAEVIEKRPANKNPTARFIYPTIQALETGPRKVISSPR